MSLTDARLPPEVLSLVAQHCCNTIQLRTLSAAFSWHSRGSSIQSLIRKRRQLVTIVACVLNMAAFDGNIQVLRWAIDAFEVEFREDRLVEFPFALALEQGHTHILQHFFPAVLPLEPLQHMNKSIPVAIKNGHVETVEWVLGRLEELGFHSLSFRSTSGGTYPNYSFEQLREDISDRKRLDKKVSPPFIRTHSLHNFSEGYCTKITACLSIK